MLRTRKWLQSILLLALGLYFLDNMVSGRIYLYINERFAWLSWLATGIFTVLGVMGIWDLLRAQRKSEMFADMDHDHDDHDHDHDHHDHEHDHGEHDHHDHDHDHEHELAEVHSHAGHTHPAAPSWPILALVAIPLALGVLVPAKPLGAEAIGTSGVSTSFSSIQGSGSTTQLTTAPTDRNVLDWVRAFNGSSNVTEFNGQPADLIGFVYRDVRFDGNPNEFMVARFAISCCVADASAIGVIVQTPGADKLAQDSWVHVTGQFQTQDFDKQQTPILVADKVVSTTQPDHPYLYP